MKDWLKRNWKSNLMGLLTLGVTAYNVYSNPASLSNPATLAAITNGVGLIALNEGDKKIPPAAPAH